jgi:F420-non-reducing hydrogenase iron-sulfur subunit
MQNSTVIKDDIPDNTVNIEKAKKMEVFEPRIIGFLCNWCSYAGADKAGAAQKPYSPNVSVIKVMCSGRIDPQFILEAFEKGADGVMILACHPGDCHYKEGNYRAVQRHRLLLRLLKQFGIAEERCRFDYVSAGEGDRFVSVINETVEAVKKLGPLII